MSRRGTARCARCAEQRDAVRGSELEARDGLSADASNRRGRARVVISCPHRVGTDEATDVPRRRALVEPEPRSQNARPRLLLHEVRKRGGFHVECSCRSPEKPNTKETRYKNSTANSHPTSQTTPKRTDINPDVIALSSSPQTQKTWTAEAHRRKGHYVAHCSSATHHTRALPRSTSHLRHKHGEASRHVLRRLRSASRPLSPERVGRRES